MLRSLLKLIKAKDPVGPIIVPATIETPSTARHDVAHPSDMPSDKPSAMIAGKIGESGIVEVNEATVPAANHRAWLLSKQLSHIKICNTQRCQKLAEYGVLTAGDLAKVDAEDLVRRMNAPASAIRSIKRYSASVRLAASVPGLMPRDAQILIRIHRHSIRAIAMDTPAVLYQDFQRFAHSTAGRKIIGERRLPSMRKVKSWITSCRNHDDGCQSMRAAA